MTSYINFCDWDYILSVAFQMHKQFKAEIDENQFETCIDAGLLELFQKLI